MAVTTTRAHVNMALHIKSKVKTTYLGIGGSEPWDDEDNPPIPERSREALETPIGYKKVNIVSLCSRVAEEEDASHNTVNYRGELWELIPDGEAHERGATHIYYETRIVGEELPTGAYRQVGIFTDLEAVSGSPTPALLPAEVTDPGTLEFFDNRQAQNRTKETNIVERFIISVAERR